MQVAWFWGWLGGQGWHKIRVRLGNIFGAGVARVRSGERWGSALIHPPPHITPTPAPSTPIDLAIINFILTFYSN